MNLIEGLQDECNRVRDIIHIYEETPNGHFAAQIMRQEIKEAEKAIAAGNTIEMIRILKSLQGYTL